MRKPEADKRAPRGDRPLAQVKCFNCSRMGHYATDCPNKKSSGHYQREYVRAAHTESDRESAHANSTHDQSDYDGSDEREEDHHEYSDVEDDETGSQHLSDVPYEAYANEYYSRDSDTERINMMVEESHLVEYCVMDQCAAMTEMPSNTKVVDVPRRKGTFKSSNVARARPITPPDEKACLVTYCKVDGHESWTLWDSGSTSTAITPAFADVAGIIAFPLQDPFMVQLGTVGSRAKITHGAEVMLQMPGHHELNYVDICNLDRYDMIVGTPFMHKYGVILDFETNHVRIKGAAISALRYPADIDPRLHRHRVNDDKAK